MVESEKIARAFTTPVSRTRGRSCQINTGMGLHTRAWEKRTKANTVVCTHTPKEHGRGLNVRRVQIQNSGITWAKIGEHGRVPWLCVPKSINTLHYSSSSSPKIPNPSHCKSTRPPCHARIPCQAHVARKLSLPLRKSRKGRLPQGLPQKFTIHTSNFHPAIRRNYSNWLTIHLRPDPLQGISSLSLIEVSPKGISSMLSMRMVERRQGTHPPQYRLAQSAEEGDPEDITDDVPPRHEDPPS
ncbi:hypothetical protein GOBAR_AA15088 [Gossypium barbadense]|uniref:Uncharacterized protein n=1 Tax=Gossypium barbadense TaxID=3634 RepID=A0A2P5XQF1_GOSBA|nr:hypothetical protein GOBAR_AA15088 [Gossypium barbadense]